MSEINLGWVPWSEDDSRHILRAKESQVRAHLLDPREYAEQMSYLRRSIEVSCNVEFVRECQTSDDAAIRRTATNRLKEIAPHVRCANRLVMNYSWIGYMRYMTSDSRHADTHFAYLEKIIDSPHKDVSDDMRLAAKIRLLEIVKENSPTYAALVDSV